MSYFDNLDWGNWLQGVWNAFIGGASSGVVAGVAISQVDPHGDVRFGSSASVKVMLSVAATSGFFQLFAYLKQNPSPAVIKTSTTVVTKSENPQRTVTTKVEETSVKPQVPDDPETR